MTQVEIWKAIKGYEEYKISNQGRVKSLRTGIILKQQLKKIGYYVVCFSVDGNKKTVLVHRLLAMAFIKNPDNLPQVDHINGIRSDNRIDNLQWVTRSGNMRNQLCHREKKDVGVFWSTKQSKWVAAIFKNNKQIYIGAFDNKNEAIKARTEAQTKYWVNNEDYIKKQKGFSFHKGKWNSYINVDKKLKHLGCFHTKEEAINARIRAEKELKSQKIILRFKHPKLPLETRQ